MFFLKYNIQLEQILDQFEIYVLFIYWPNIVRNFVFISLFLSFLFISLKMCYKISINIFKSQELTKLDAFLEQILRTTNSFFPKIFGIAFGLFTSMLTLMLNLISISLCYFFELIEFTAYGFFSETTQKFIELNFYNIYGVLLLFRFFTIYVQYNSINLGINKYLFFLFNLFVRILLFPFYLIMIFVFLPKSLIRETWFGNISQKSKISAFNLLNAPIIVNDAQISSAAQSTDSKQLGLLLLGGLGFIGICYCYNKLKKLIVNINETQLAQTQKFNKLEVFYIENATLVNTNIIKQTETITNIAQGQSSLTSVINSQDQVLTDLKISLLTQNQELVNLKSLVIDQNTQVSDLSQNHGHLIEYVQEVEQSKGISDLMQLQYNHERAVVVDSIKSSVDSINHKTLYVINSVETIQDQTSNLNEVSAKSNSSILELKENQVQISNSLSELNQQNIKLNTVVSQYQHKTSEINKNLGLVFPEVSKINSRITELNNSLISGQEIASGNTIKSLILDNNESKFKDLTETKLKIKNAIDKIPDNTKKIELQTMLELSSQEPNNLLKIVKALQYLVFENNEDILSVIELTAISCLVIQNII